MGAYFRGEYSHRLDSKKRVAIPADFRRAINDGRMGGPHQSPEGVTEPARVTIVYGDDRLECLKCYSEQAISKIDEAISSLGRATSERRFLEFFFQTRSVTVQLDPSGRLVLAEFLRKKINLDSIVCFAGKGDSFEIWNPDSFEVHQTELAGLFRDGDTATDPMSLIDACQRPAG